MQDVTTRKSSTASLCSLERVVRLRGARSEMVGVGRDDLADSRPHVEDVTVGKTK